jgi:3-hydroxyisobutyrate dehydrogenase
MLKDLRLAEAAAADVGAATPLAAHAAALYADFVENGGGEYDFSAIINWILTLSAGTT